MTRPYECPRGSRAGVVGANWEYDGGGAAGVREGTGVADELYVLVGFGVMRPGIRVRSIAYLNSFSSRRRFSRSQLEHVSQIILYYWSEQVGLTREPS